MPNFFLFTASINVPGDSSPGRAVSEKKPELQCARRLAQERAALRRALIPSLRQKRLGAEERPYL